MRKPSNSEALHALFHPRAVAVLGVSEEPTKHNHIVFANAKASTYAGNVYPIHRTLTEVAGARCYENPAALPEPVDLVFLAIPADATLVALRECAAVGIKVAIVGSAGFAESGEEGRARQDELAGIIETSGIRIVGPNCNGIYNATTGLSVGFNTAHSRRIKAGDIAILSHSGALFDILVTQLDALGAGMSVFVSCGNEVDFDILDYLEYLIDDPATKVISLLIDSLSDGARFRQLAARAYAAGKQIVALKLGVTDVGAKAAVAHSSRLAGGATAYKALFEASGVPLVSSLEGLTTAAAMLSLFGRREGGLAVLSNSGAGASLLGDLTGKIGVPLAQYEASTFEALARFKRFSEIGNPTDFGVFGDRRKAREVPSIMAADPHVGMFLAQMHAQRPWQRIPTMDALSLGRSTSGKPFVVLAPGGLFPEAYEECARAGMYVFKDTNATLQGIAAVLTPPPRPLGATRDAAGLPDVDKALPRGEALSEPDSLGLLGRFGVSVVRTEICTSLDQALSAAQAIGWPVVLKGVVAGLAHKSDAGLVRVDIRDAASLRAAFADFGNPDTVVVQPFARGRFEAIAGVTMARDVGPILLAGLGGIFAEALNDVTMWAIPADRETIRRDLSGSALGRLLLSPRWDGAGALDALLDVLMRLQDLTAWAGDRLTAVDLNPLIISESGVLAVDALVVPAPLTTETAEAEPAEAL